MNHRHNCIIVDDEPPARNILKTYIEAVPSLELKAEYANAVDALGFLQVHKIDVIFLDIHMPRLLGTAFAGILQNKSKIIFTTAYKKYALEGFDLDAVDFLVKPVSFERFLKAVNKLESHAPAPTLIPPAREQTAIERVDIANFLYFRVDRVMKKVWLKDILFIESLKDYVKIVTIDNALVTKQSISSLEAMLPGHVFIRVHRSYIVSKTRINAFTNEWVKMGKEQLPIGRLYRQMVVSQLQKSCPEL